MICRKITSSSDLYETEDGRVACGTCVEEDPMAKSKDKRKKIASLEIFEVELEGGEKDKSEAKRS